MNKKIIVNIIFIIPVLVCMATIFLFSAQPAVTSTQTSSGFALMLAKTITPDFDTLNTELKQEVINSCQFYVRKAAHFSIYAILGIFSYISLCTFDRLKPKTRFILPVLICLIYAVSDELHQYFVPGRSCQFSDVMLDFIGSLTGIVIITVIYNLLKKRTL